MRMLGKLKQAAIIGQSMYSNRLISSNLCRFFSSMNSLNKQKLKVRSGGSGYSLNDKEAAGVRQTITDEKIRETRSTWACISIITYLAYIFYFKEENDVDIVSELEKYKFEEEVLLSSVEDRLDQGKDISGIVLRLKEVQSYIKELKKKLDED